MPAHALGPCLLLQYLDGQARDASKLMPLAGPRQNPRSMRLQSRIVQSNLYQWKESRENWLIKITGLTEYVRTISLLLQTCHLRSLSKFTVQNRSASAEKILLNLKNDPRGYMYFFAQISKLKMQTDGRSAIVSMKDLDSICMLVDVCKDYKMQNSFFAGHSLKYICCCL